MMRNDANQRREKTVGAKTRPAYCEVCDEWTTHVVTHEGGLEVETCSRCGVERCGKEQRKGRGRAR